MGVPVEVFWSCFLCQIFPAYSGAVATIVINSVDLPCFSFLLVLPTMPDVELIRKGHPSICRVGSRPFQAAQMIAFRSINYMHFPKKCIRDRLGREVLAPSM